MLAVFVVGYFIYAREKNQTAYLLALAYLIYILLLPVGTSTNAGRYLAIVEPIPLLLLSQLIAGPGPIFGFRRNSGVKSERYFRRILQFGAVGLFAGWMGISAYVKLHFKDADITKVIHQVGRLVPQGQEAAAEIIMGLFPEELKVVFPLKQTHSDTNWRQIKAVGTPYIISSRKFLFD